MNKFIEYHIMFSDLQEKAESFGLILEFNKGAFLFKTGGDNKYKDPSGNIINPNILDVSNQSFEYISACIDMWKFCKDYYESR